jgi:cytochrome P450
VTANLLFIVNTAHRDLTQAVALALLTLCRHPELVREWHDNPERIDDAVDELLRLETPLQFVTRVTADELRIDDVIVPAGWTVLVMLGAANRDPEQFPDPDHLDSRNHSRPAIGFGHGIHRCPGAGFSRIVVAAVVAAVLEHASQLELVEPPLWATSRPEMRGLDRLVVRW